MEFERIDKSSLDEKMKSIKNVKYSKLIDNNSQAGELFGVRRPIINLEIEFEVDRIKYIKNSMNDLAKNDMYSLRTIEVIQQVFIEYNIDMREILLDCENNIDEYYFTAVVIYKMIKSGLFSEEEYIDVADNIFVSPYLAEKYWRNLLKTKTVRKDGGRHW